jgi:hypothetical protein
LTVRSWVYRTRFYPSIECYYLGVKFERHPFLEIHVQSVDVPRRGRSAVPAEIRAHIRSNIQSSGDEAALNLDKAAPGISLGTSQRRILPLIVASLADLSIVALSPALVGTDLFLVPLLLVAPIVALFTTAANLTAVLLVHQEIVESASDLATKVSKAADIALVALRAADILEHDERKRVALQASLATVNLDADRVVKLDHIEPSLEILISVLILPRMMLAKHHILSSKLSTSGSAVQLVLAEIVEAAVLLVLLILLAIVEVLRREANLDLGLTIRVTNAYFTLLATGAR